MIRNEGSNPLGKKLRYRLSFLLADPEIWYWVALLLTICLFVHSLFVAGPAWDEPEEFGKLQAQLAFAQKFLSESNSRSFSSLPNDSAYYGVGSVLIPYALSYLVDVVWLRYPVHSYEHSYSVFLHLTSFLCMLAAVVYTRRLVALITKNREVGFLAGLTLLLTPFWMGYGFIDYKDIPVATGAIAATYYSILYYEDGLERTSLCFFLALFFIGIQKLAAIPLVLPACALVALAVVRSPSVRRVAVIFAHATLCLGLLYLATPPGWPAPAEFAIESVLYSSQHFWGGCTLTAGRCIGRLAANGEGYLAFKYLALWFAVKLPILMWAGFVGAAVFYLRSFRQLKAANHLVVAAFWWPIAALGLRNSTLYDGIRHVLFSIPLAVTVIFISVPVGVWLRNRWALGFYFLFLAIDTLKLQPYQYVWFNEPARFFASEKNFETDYWGYSLREATAVANNERGSGDWIISQPGDANPSHLVGIYAKERFAQSAGSVPPGATYYAVSVTRMNRQPPKQCSKVDYITRTELFAPFPLRLSFIAKCEPNAR